MKNERRRKILELIARESIETQEDLLERLAACGINATQATISRDIKQLHLYKEPCGKGHYRYAAAENSVDKDYTERMEKILSESCLSVAAARNLVLLHTMPGVAGAAGAAFDSMGIRDLLGCVAGDDTVMAILRNAEAAEALCAEIQKYCK